MEEEKKIRELAEDIHCGVPLARDLLVLAGGDYHLVRKASSECHGVDALKAFIIDQRFKKNQLV